MDTKREGDRSFERLLRQSLRSNAGSALTGGCLDAETIAAWADGSLNQRDRALAEAHASECARCQATVATLMKMSAAPPAPDPWWRRRLNLGWLVPLTAGAIAVAFWFALPNPPSPGLSDKREVQSRADESAKPQEQSGLARSDAPLVQRQQPAAPASPPVVQGREPAAPSEPLAPRQQRAAPAATGRNESKEEREGAIPTRRAKRDERPASAPAQLKEADALEKAAPAAAPTAAVVAGNAAQSSVGRRDQAAALSAPAVAPAREIQSPDTSVRWRFGAGGLVQYSIDRGATWEGLSTDFVADLTAGAAPSSSVCWLVGRAGTVLLTTDGRRFARLPFPESADLAAVRATDARTAVVTTADGRTFNTADGGSTWTEAPR